MSNEKGVAQKKSVGVRRSYRLTVVVGTFLFFFFFFSPPCVRIPNSVITGCVSVSCVVSLRNEHMMCWSRSLSKLFIPQARRELTLKHAEIQKNIRSIARGLRGRPP